jgi:hypothetical protein
VWFVAGTVGGADVKRTCTVPAGRPISGPLLAIAPEKPDGCAEFIAAADGEVVLDGSPVDVRRVDPEPVTVAGGNPQVHPGGEAYACGLWFTLAPLGQGEHKLTVNGVSGATRVGVEYTLKVG